MALQVLVVVHFGVAVALKASPYPIASQVLVVVHFVIAVALQASQYPIALQVLVVVHLTTQRGIIINLTEWCMPEKLRINIKELCQAIHQ